MLLSTLMLLPLAAAIVLGACAMRELRSGEIISNDIHAFKRRHHCQEPAGAGQGHVTPHTPIRARANCPRKSALEGVALRMINAEGQRARFYYATLSRHFPIFQGMPP
jgi:hypothetical protein